MNKIDFEKMMYADLDGHPWIRLMDLDVEKAKVVAQDIAARKSQKLVRNRADRAGLCGELAFSRYANISTRHDGDCEFGIEVKALTREGTWPYINKNEILETRPYVFVTSYLHPVYELIGWQWGEFIRQYPGSDKWTDCYRLHKDLLMPISSLLDHIKEWRKTDEQSNSLV